MPTATCLTLAAALAAAQPGDTVRLEGRCGDIVLPRRDHARPVTINATGATLRSLRFQGTAGWTWRGGAVIGDLPPAQYFGVTIDGSRRIEIAGMMLTGTMVGVTVTRGSSEITLRGNLATGLQSDGFNVAGSTRVDIFGNTCADFRPILPIYDALGRLLKDGTHNDCIQLWGIAGHETSRIRIVGNSSTGYGQGIGQYWSDGPIRNVLVAYNFVLASTWNAISFSNAEGLTIRDNVVRTVPGAKAPNFPFQSVRAWIYDKLGKATRCGNEVDGQGDGACSTG